MRRSKEGGRSHGDKTREARENRHVKAREEKAAPTLDEHDLMRLVAEWKVPFLLILDCVQDPHNLGAILRSADGAGVHAVIAPKDKAVGINETVRRISVGAADYVPFFQVTNLARTMEQLKEAGLWIVGTSDRAENALRARFTRPSCPRFRRGGKRNAAPDGGELRFSREITDGGKSRVPQCFCSNWRLPI